MTKEDNSMSKEDLVGYLMELSKKRPVFYSEADFQLELALILVINGYDVRLEKSYSQVGPYKKIELDIELNNSIAIELKYKTQSYRTTHGDETFDLKNHGAQNLGRFDAFDDARRVCLLKKSNQTKIGSGFTVFLTNDFYYWEKDAAGSMSEQFSLQEDRSLCAGSSHDWVGNSLNPQSLTKKRMDPYAPIMIEFNDKITWHDYSHFFGTKNGLFRFFVLDVNN